MPIHNLEKFCVLMLVSQTIMLYTQTSFEIIAECSWYLKTLFTTIFLTRPYLKTLSNQIH